ncbi:hypothetical protein SAMN05421505_10515 [Sinosporangium album]|uniref:ATP-grasp domain-containing protein n=1 Tax=Sinosporangium album TaxID=504805 RepID=A0A1G7UXZ3_9ACTN|nr:STM4014 family protein [Sinosporangium album]SDG52158.1 hypothetical protein SAMN05421505_10515 [Sinosporangium album]
MRLAVVGTPGDRRVTMFRDAAVARGLAEPHVVAWRDVLSGVTPELPPGTLVRVDSPGEDAETDALLRGPGDPTRVGGGAAWHTGFMKGLSTVASFAGAGLLDDIDEIAVMFDKRLSHARLSEAGVPVPAALPGPISSYAALREQMADAGWSRVFVKPAHGSSASGVIALQALGSRIRAVTSAAWVSGGLHNSLRVRAYESEPDVRALVDVLAPDGLHVERWFPKASYNDMAFDLRVVTVVGVPTHAVARASRTPMTNLHLGGVRGDLGLIRERLGPARWGQCLRVCADAAACFPRSLRVGVDLMVGADWRSLAVAEVNAFGDLLPGLGALNGDSDDTYTAQVRALIAGWRPPARRPSDAPHRQPAPL